MPTKRDKIRSAVLEGIRKHEAAKKNPSFQKNQIAPFLSVSAICNYLYEFEFILDKKQAEEVIKAGKDINKYNVASKNTIRSIIEDFIGEGILVRDGEELVLNESFYSERSQFPILQIANRIPIEMLPPEDIMFLSAPPQYASAISEYINAVFYKKDITATVVGDLIMCMSVYPKEAYEDGFNPNPDHTERFFTQLTGALADFNLSFRDFKYGDDYYSQYGQHYDPTMVHAIDEIARKMATFDGREFNKRTYEKCKYLFMLAMNGEPVPMSFIDDLRQEDPALFNHINAFFNSVGE